MSQENVDLVLGIFAPADVDLASIIRDDDLWSAYFESLAPKLHPDFESATHWFGAEKTYTGRDGIREGLLDWYAPWATYRIEIQEAIDLGEQVLLRLADFGRREGSAEEVRGNTAHVWNVRDGKIARFDAYTDYAEALEAVGLSE